MITHIPYQHLHHHSQEWLDSRFHFSFAEYRDFKKRNFGVLRVMNDDIIAPRSGFEMHPHRDMEIVTYIVEGALTHEDSMHNKETLYRGDMQFMSAGSGLSHSEKNEGDSEVRLLQLWIYPQEKGIKPVYGSRTFTHSQRRNLWLHLVSPHGGEGEAEISQDANIFVTELDAGMRADFEVSDGRQAYLKLIEGEALINGLLFKHGDASEVRGVDIVIEAVETSHILLVEMEADNKVE